MKKTFTYLCASMTILIGCTTQDSSPLLFGQATTLGVSVAPSATAAQTPEFVVGFKQANTAVVPTVIPADVLPGIKPGNGRISSFSGDTQEDALSVFGSFSNQNSGGGVNLGVFFATGVAAQKLADGFRCGTAGIALADCKQ